MHRPTVPGRSLMRAGVSLLACLLLLVAVPASAEEPADAPQPAAVQRTGSCSGPTNWRLVLRRGDPGQLVVTFTASGGASDQKWNVFIEDKGTGIYAGSRTSGDNGYFRVRKVTKDLPGVDKFTVGANNAATGETCTAHASI